MSDFCQVNHFEPSFKTKEAIEDMNNIVEMSSYLDTILRAIPFFQIFADRNSYLGVSTVSASYQISTSDWKSYADAISAVPQIKRNRLEFIAGQAMNSTMGEESKFWGCVYNALR
ncbi:hypothetical protein [Photobacterium lipolyticum]|uniref:Uncharacterized protein n=1 Tax=Photobacterium lipolyticum TaxID=266810 RepID=A0A2T3MWV7_9GAMM|nr:hypothetical protein [Photobacterium lipolyticum]PSW04465.1 hypothetical protein C9I89_14220 [Photobacterium lipolyticum]